MKVSIRDSGLTEWFLCHVVASDQVKFDEVVSQDGWDSENIELSVSLNGVEFTELGELFGLLEKHLDSKAKEIAGQDVLMSAKIDAMHKIINAETIEELEFGD